MFLFMKHQFLNEHIGIDKLNNAADVEYKIHYSLF